MGKKILIGSIVCIVLISIPATLFFLKSSQNNNSYTYFGHTLSLGDYSYTKNKLEVIFIGRLDSMYSASNGIVYGTITYSKTGGKKVFSIPTHIPQKYDLLVLFKPEIPVLTNVEKQKPLYPNVSDIKQLQGRIMAFYLPAFDPNVIITPEKKIIYHEYFNFANTHFLCNQQFIQELTGSPTKKPCAPFIETIVVKI